MSLGGYSPWGCRVRHDRSYLARKYILRPLGKKMSLRKTLWKLLKNLKIELLYEPEIPLLGLYLEKTIIWKDMHTPIAALFTTAKTQKQPKCPLTDEWKKKMQCVCVCVCVCVCKTQWDITQPWQNNAIYSYMDGPRDYHSNWSQPERDRCHMISLTW